MRGALEASRLREEKNKAEIDKYMKEIETMKWEGANWRRAEIEVSVNSMVAGFIILSLQTNHHLSNFELLKGRKEAKELNNPCFFFWAPTLLLFGSMLTPLINFTCH